MATQQVLFAETIAGMKKAFKRKAYESDSDSEIENYSNRGHKLKKRARFAHKGQLVPAGGPSAYREPVDYAGVRRAIIHRNPPLIDDEGYELDSEDDDRRVEDALIVAAELNPYANIRLEHVLAPLTASTDLSTHPTLSKPFTAKTLTDLVSQSCNIMRKENSSLWQVRHLWTSLCGDSTWVPCETMAGPNDIELYTDDLLARHLQSLAKGEASPVAAVNGDVQNGSVSSGSNTLGSTKEAQKLSANAQENADVSMADADVADGADGPTSATKASEARVGKNGSTKGERHDANGDGKSTDDHQNDEAAKASSGNKESHAGGDAANEARPEINGNQAPVTTTDNAEQPFIHPMFIPPPEAKPDRNLGLPEAEADDIRRLLALYVQKQEEVCRGAKRLHQGLLRAERLRADVLHWSKAEAHAGANRDMSDGEDWYDKEEWGLTEDLKKGQDEEEEDTTTTQKKTRARR